MKVSLVVALCVVFVAGQANAAEKMQLKTEKEKLSYTKGVNLGNNFKRQSVEVDRNIFLRGIQDALSGAQPLLTTQEMAATEESFQKERAAERQEQNRIVAEKNLKEGEAFLAENAKKKGVITLPSGLQYKVITAGKGKKPKATDKVIVNYRGALIDGSVFDDSNNHKEHPAVMPVSGDKNLIAGWTEALLLMNEGSKWQVFIPASLGYKDQRLWTIGPNSVLLFDIELLSVQKASEAEKRKN